MKRQKLFLIFTLLFALSAALTMTRCGSGVGPTASATANGAKF